ncbi:MAG: DUF4388 domain-containing protein [Candidatus Eisenbacteria bacterium]
MALQGNLRDFSATEILQLIASQKKSGCLALEWNTERAFIWVHEGRIVSTRQAGISKDDPLLHFLKGSGRLSDEQVRGILTIQRESNRDLEDLLVNGRYLDAEELAGFIERQILDDLMRIVRWDSGTYRFDPTSKWAQAPLVMLSMEGAVIEAARRVDEQKMFVTVFRDPYQLLGVRDLPDPDEPLSEEEREIFGIIDGKHTVAEVVERAPLSEYEAYEALQRMLEARWIEFSGRRDPGVQPVAAPAEPVVHDTRPRNSIVRELAVAGGVLAVFVVLRFLSLAAPIHPRATAQHDVFAAAQVRDLRYALDLYRREQGAYPRTLQTLVEDRWIAPDQVRISGYEVLYRPEAGGTNYALDLRAAR